MAIISALYQRQLCVPSKTAAWWEIEPKKLQCSGWRNLRYDQSAEQVYRVRYA